jgi:hypothetical protein
MKAVVSSFQPASVIDHLRMKSPLEICAFSLYPPIYIPTDRLNPKPINIPTNSPNPLFIPMGTRNPNPNPIYIPTNTLNPNPNPVFTPTDSLIHPNVINDTTMSSIRNSNEVRPILDVVGLKICSFKNAIAAIKMFLSAQTVVDS